MTRNPAPLALPHPWTSREFWLALAAVMLFWAAAAAIWPLNGAVVPWDSKNHFYPMLRYLGAALANYRGFGSRGFRVVAIVDSDSSKHGSLIAGLEVESTDLLPRIVHERGVAHLEAFGEFAQPGNAFRRQHALRPEDRRLGVGIEAHLQRVVDRARVVVAEHADRASRAQQVDHLVRLRSVPHHVAAVHDRRAGRLGVDVGHDGEERLEVRVHVGEHRKRRHRCFTARRSRRWPRSCRWRH